MFDRTQAVQALKAHVETIPQAKRAKKFWRAFAGLVLAALTTLGVVYVRFDPVPWWAYAIGYACAGYLISPDVMAALRSFIIGAIKDVLSAIKGTP